MVFNDVQYLKQILLKLLFFSDFKILKFDFTLEFFLMKNKIFK